MQRIREFIRRLQFARARRRYERASAMLAASLAEIDEEMLAADEMVVVADQPAPEMKREDCPETIPCICCGKRLRDWSGDNNQPFEALEFATRGHYPSAIFDGQPGELIVNVCDACLLAGARAGRVLKRTYPTPRRRGDQAVFEPWKGRRTGLPGSGNFLRDMGYQNPDEMRDEFELANKIALAVERIGIERAAVSAGLTVDRLSAIVDGRVRDVPVGEMRRVLAAVSDKE